MNQPLKPFREQLLHSFPAVFSGIDRIIMLRSSSKGALNGQELIRNGTNYRLRTLIIDGLDSEGYIKQENSGYAWLHPNELPFDRKKNAKVNHHLFSEEQYLVLCIKVETIRVILESAVYKEVWIRPARRLLAPLFYEWYGYFIDQLINMKSIFQCLRT